MKKGRRYTQEEIVLISQSAIGKTFRELMNSELITFESEENKGTMFTLIFPIPQKDKKLLTQNGE